MEKVFLETGIDTLAEPVTPPKRKAISYCRYSSLSQGRDGRHSTQRQKDALNEALARWNLELDQELIDKGKSGYHQRHLAKGGAMYRLRHMALEGQLVGKVIVLEDWDRAGRMEVMDAAILSTTSGRRPSEKFGIHSTRAVMGITIQVILFGILGKRGNYKG